MNENELNNPQKKETYHATTNLNIDIENPQIRINSAVGMNIKDMTNNNIPNAPIPNDSFDNIGYNQEVTPNNIQTSYLENVNTNNTLNHNNLNLHQQIKSEEPLKTSPQPTTYINNNVQYVPTTPENNPTIYEPTMKEKKKKRSKISLPLELKVTIFIVFILLLFILMMPYIYDFFKNLQLAFTR